MAIIVKDISQIVVKQARLSEEELRAENQRLRELSEATRDNSTRLYVNGKERKIGKKSQYLLDMLTLPED